MSSLGARRGPTVYDPEHHPALAARLCAKGATMDDLARKLGAARSTVFLWMKEHPAFAVAVREGKEAADDQVEAALFKRATGYRCRAVRTHVVSAGQGAGSHVEKVPVTEIYPPDVAAVSLWLRNRRGDAWREKSEVTVNGGFAERLARARARAAARQAQPSEPANVDGQA